MKRKIIAVIVCLIIWMGYTIFLASQGIETKNLGGTIPAVIFIMVLTFVWKKITGSKKQEEDKENN